MLSLFIFVDFDVWIFKGGVYTLKESVKTKRFGTPILDE